MNYRKRELGSVPLRLRGHEAKYQILKVIVRPSLDALQPHEPLEGVRGEVQAYGLCAGRREKGAKK